MAVVAALRRLTAVRYNFKTDPGVRAVMSKLMQQLKRIILFLLSPLFALAYMATFPMVALGMLKTLLKTGEMPKSDEPGRLA